MNDKQKILHLWKWPAIILLVIGCVMLIRHCCIGSYRISTESMEEALHKGDYVLVNKLSLPDNPGRNRVVLFRSPLSQDAVKRPLFVSRCIGLPGDTIRISPRGYQVNGKPIPRSPLSLNTFYIKRSDREQLEKIMSQLEITQKKMNQIPYGYTFTLTTFEEYLIREELPEGLDMELVEDQSEAYSLVVPQKGKPYRLNEAALIACREIILAETNGKAVFKDGLLYINNKEMPYFLFEQDYYWLLSDNPNEAIDSRQLGFVPEDLIVGNVWFCWYSKDKKNQFKFVY
ncbi:signal peptidase I [Parabacteroides sp. PF5-9]|uniref:signal peptidase I n=1 Tax=Parabacteroides sp. PF5-9 TaxID=1742404 RepID=UPI0024758122|nr:signal peptidase I [Parabacteroides sp. PF5-9]MDH6357686.1 signal peptidase I [Parabacteroides sp. PF5-9]